jgi:hypothetical protein
MKEKFKFFVFFLAAALVLMACQNPAGDDEDGSGGVNFTSHTPPSIWVDNNSSQRLVAFKGSVNTNTLIGGIPANASQHGLAKDLFTQTGDFALVLITEAEYNRTKNNLSQAVEFTRVYAFYNHEATNNNVFAISGKSGGTGRITLNNTTGFNIEIRKDGPTGEVLGYVASQMTNTILRVEAPGDYSLYPVFKKYNTIDREIYSTVPKYQSGALTGKPYAKDFALPQSDTAVTWSLSEVADNVNMTLSSGSFFFRIQNNAGTSVRFTKGDEEQVTSTGIKGIGPTASNTFAVKIERNPDGTYPSSVQISGLKIGTMQNALTVPDQAYKPDYIYTITVTGADASNLVLGAVAESESPVDLDQMFGY